MRLAGIACKSILSARTASNVEGAEGAAGGGGWGICGGGIAVRPCVIMCADLNLIYASHLVLPDYYDLHA